MFAFTSPQRKKEFDESLLEVEFMYGKSQLQEIRLVAKWRTAMTQRVPTFNCKWYSKK
jgi:hypothetical protein